MKEEQKTQDDKPAGFFSKPLWGWLAFAGIMLVSCFLFVWLLFAGAPWVKNQAVFYKLEPKQSEQTESNSPTAKELTADIGRLLKKLERLTPGGVYLVINTSDNHFFLYKNRQMVREGLCSTGSYIKLETESEKNWLFHTPKGVFTIKGKVVDPVWHKPDWAFVEEGLPIPPAGHPSRYEHGVLGDYALALGDGYLIHGTLYKRFLGQPVTHGCVRLNDEDLEAVYKTLPIGAKVFIY